MKILDIALKDIVHSFRNAFALLFMFVMPITVTMLFYFMFGSAAGNEFNVPKTKVIIVNQDQGSLPPSVPPSLPDGNASGSDESGQRWGDERGVNLPGGMQINSLGQFILLTLKSSSFADLIDVSVYSDAASARTDVDKQKAGVAIIIPEDFTAAYADSTRKVSLELYKDPTLTLGPSIVQSILDQLMDTFSGARIAVNVAIAQTQGADPNLVEKVMEQYMAAAFAQQQDSAALLETYQPAKSDETTSPMLGVITTIMGGMMVFYAFYTGSASAQTILQEDEAGTLPRLFTTPTPQSSILAGKFLAVGLTVVIQMTTLLIFARLVFGIQWGAPLPVLLATIGTMATSATMGIFLNSLLKDTRQGGSVFGGLLTITGMIGMLPVFTQGSPSTPAALKTISLLVPQGWAIRGLFQAVNGEALSHVLVSLLVLLAMSTVFFSVGVWRFQKRYA